MKTLVMYALVSLCVLFYYSTPGYGQDDSKKVPTFNTDFAYQCIQKQVSFGPRVPNTQAHRLCGAYLQQQLVALGAMVHVQQFQAQAFDGRLLELQNIIASFYPTCQKRILLAAHWDTRPVADKDEERPMQPIEGANDGASGVGVLLALAQAISEYPPAGIGVDIIFLMEKITALRPVLCPPMMRLSTGVWEHSIGLFIRTFPTIQRHMGSCWIW